MNWDKYTAMNIISLIGVCLGIVIIFLFARLWYQVLTDPIEPVTETTTGLMTSCFNFAFVYCWIALMILRARKKLFRNWNYMATHNQKPYRYDEPSIYQDYPIVFLMVFFSCALGYYTFDWMMDQSTFVRGAFSLIPIVVTLMLECLLSTHNRMRYTGCLLIPPAPPAPPKPDDIMRKDYRRFGILSVIGLILAILCTIGLSKISLCADLEDRDEMTLAIDMLFGPFLALVFGIDLHILSRFSNLQWYVIGKGMTDDEYYDNSRALTMLHYSMAFGCLFAIIIPIRLADTFNAIEDSTIYALSCSIPFLIGISIYLLLRILYCNKKSNEQIQGALR